MKPMKIICTLAFCMGILSAPAYAASTCTATLTDSTTSSTTSIENCTNGEKYRWKNSSGTYVTVESCLDCSNGYTLTEDVSYSHCTNKFTRGICAKACTAETIKETSMPDGCTGRTAYAKKFGDTEYVECTECATGYKEVQNTISSSQCTNTTTQYACEVDPDAECFDDSDCDEYRGKTLYGPDSSGVIGVVDMVWCSSDGTCEYDLLYQCARGYYGGSGYSLGSVTCTACPSEDGGIPTTTSGTGAMDITDCYAPKDIAGNDVIGTYSFIQDCKYSDN